MKMPPAIYFVAPVVVTVMCLASYKLGWAQRGDAIYSAMFENTVAAMPRIK